MHPNAKRRREPYYSSELQSWCVPLTQGVIALVDADDLPTLTDYNWYAAKGAQGWVAQRNSHEPQGNRHTVLMHISIMAPSVGMYVDHKIHRPHADKIVDNRKDNLRICHQWENLRNQRPKRKRNKTSRFKGVFWLDRTQYGRTGRWVAAIEVNGRPKVLSRFKNEEDAARCYDQGASQQFGEFALTNEMLGLLPSRRTDRDFDNHP